MKLLSVVMPVFNERRTVEEILRRVRAAPTCGLAREIVVVDDGSSDGTRELLAALPAADDLVLVFKERNAGKGAALRDGFSRARGDIVLIQDADLEYDPSEYPRLLQPILDDHADVVYGSRFLGGPHRVLYYWHYVANVGLTQLANAAANINLTDMETCYKAFRAEALKSLLLESDRFGFEPEVTIKVARAGFRIYEVPVSYYGRTYSEGKKIGWRDGLRAIGTIARHGIVDRVLGRPFRRDPGDS